MCDHARDAKVIEMKLCATPSKSSQSGEDADWIVSEAIARGYQEMTRSKLERWHKNGLIARGHQIPLGRGRGSRTEYPSGTLDLVLRICEVHRTQRDLNLVAFELWWHGAAVSVERLRTSLRGIAVWWDRVMAILRAQRRLTGIVRRIAAARWRGRTVRLARMPRGDREVLVRSVLESVLGVYAPYRPMGTGTEMADDEGLLVERAIGLTNARSQGLAAAPPWLSGDTTALLTTTVPGLTSASMVAVLERTDEPTLVLARAEVRELGGMYRSLASDLEPYFGANPFSFGTVGRLLSPSSRRDGRLLFLLWLVLRATEGADAGIRALTAARDQWLKQRVVLDLLAALREEVPALRSLLEPKRMGRAMRTEAASRRLNERLARVAREHRESIDAFLARHPEARTV